MYGTSIFLLISQNQTEFRNPGTPPAICLSFISPVKRTEGKYLNQFNILSGTTPPSETFMTLSHLSFLGAKEKAPTRSQASFPALVGAYLKYVRQ